MKENIARNPACLIMSLKVGETRQPALGLRDGLWPNHSHSDRPGKLEIGVLASRLWRKNRVDILNCKTIAQNVKGERIHFTVSRYLETWIGTAHNWRCSWFKCKTSCGWITILLFCTTMGSDFNNLSVTYLSYRMWNEIKSFDTSTSTYSYRQYQGPWVILIKPSNAQYDERSSRDS